MFQRRKLAVGNSRERHILFSSGQYAARIGHPQSCQVAWKTAFGLHLQQARGVRHRQLRQFCLTRQCPLQRDTHDAIALAHACGVKLVADFAGDQFRSGGQRIKRECG